MKTKTNHRFPLNGIYDTYRHRFIYAAYRRYTNLRPACTDFYFTGTNGIDFSFTSNHN